MPVQLRPYQQQIESAVYSAWSNGAQNVMPVLATGAGKTAIFAKIAADETGASAAIAHRQELISQMSIALARNGVRHRLIGTRKGSNLIRVFSALHMAELGYSYFDPNAKTGVGGVDTVVRMDPTDDWFRQVRLQIQDEGHHVLKENKWGKTALLFPYARGLFPTATAIRADGRGLGRAADGLVDVMVTGPSMRAIINMGYLTDYRIFAPPSDLDLSNVDTSAATGDFNADQVRKAVHKSHITGDVVDHYLKLAPGKLGVTFAVDVEAAVEIAAAFRARGVRAEVVSAKTPDGLRQQILRQFRNREILQLVNVDLFGEGFDLPAIEVVSFARPTESFALFCQQFGRALRLMLSPDAAKIHTSLTDEGRRAAIAASGKPVALIIDHVSNVLRHGLPDAEREWSLGRRERRAKKDFDGIPLRVCGNAECVQPYERVLKCCPFCGHYPLPVARSAPEFVDGDLTELDPETLKALRGEKTRIDGDFYAPQGLSHEAQIAARRNHMARQGAQSNLRNAIAWWAGVESSFGRGESESYRRFYFKFGTDVANAQTLGAREASDLAGRIMAELQKFGVDGTVNAATYFAQREGL